MNDTNRAAFIAQASKMLADANKAGKRLACERAVYFGRKALSCQGTAVSIDSKGRLCCEHHREDGK